MALLWGSHFDAQARQNLRQALTRLRRVLGEDTLISTGETVSLQPGAIASDVARFEALLSDGSRDALNAAVGLYRGHLLADMAIPEEAWTEWIGAQRQRLEGLALDAMVKLGEQELEAGNHEPALSAANRAIAISSSARGRASADHARAGCRRAPSRRAEALRGSCCASEARARRGAGPDHAGRSPPSCADLLRAQPASPAESEPHAVAETDPVAPASSRPTLDRRAAVRQHERRSRAGVFRRRHGRRHSDGPVARALAVRDRPPVELHLQGPVRRRAADRPRARRALRGRGQRAQVRQPGAHRRPADRDRDRRPHLGRPLRGRPERHLRLAGRDHGADRLCRGSERRRTPRSGARVPSPPTV